MKPRFLATPFATALAALLATQAIHATPLYWDSNAIAAGAGSTYSGTWGTSNFWNSDSTGGAGGTFQIPTTANDNLYFVAGPSATSGNSASAVTVSTTQVARSLTFQASGAATLSGGTSVTLGDGSGGGITMGQYAYGTTAQGAVTISTPIILNNAQTWLNNAGNTLNINGAVNNNGNLLTIDGTGRTTFGAVALSGTGGLTKNGSGYVNLRLVTFSYTGPTTFNGGIVMLGGGKSTGNWTLNNSMLDDYYQANYTFSAGLGTGVNQIQIYGDSGFGAGNGPSNYTIGTANSVLTWGSTYFNPTSLKFLDSGDNLGPSIYGQVQLNNGLDLNGGARTIYVLAGTGANANNAWGKITGVIKDTLGGGSIIKTGGGNLQLTGTNTFTGGVSLSSGTVQVGSANGLGANSSPVSFTGTSTLDLRVSPTIGGLSSASGYGTITLGAAGALTLTVSQTTGTTFSGVMQNGSGTLSFSKSGSGTLELSGTSPYTGTTTVSAGTLAVSGSLSATATLTLSGGTLQVGNGGASGAINTTPAISVGTGATFAVNRSDTATQGTQFSAAAIGGAGNFSQLGSGTTVLNAANSYTGVTTVSGGTLSVTTLANGGTNSGIGASTNAAAKLILNGGTLKYTGAAASTDRQFTLGTSGGGLDASGTGPINWTSTTAPTLSGVDTARTFTLTGTNTGTNTLAAPVGDNGSGATGLAKNGASTWLLTGANTYSGNTTINGGTLELGNGGTSGTLNTASAISVVSGATFSVNHSDTMTQGSQFSVAAISGPGGFSQLGSGTTILNATNSYTGPTTVSAGSLLMNAPGSLAAGSAVSVNGGTLGGDGTINGAVTLGASGVIAPGTSAGTAGTLWIGGNLDVSALGKLNYDLDTPGTSDVIAVTGTLNIGSGVFGRSQFNFNLLGGYAAGTYTLVTTAGGIVGSLNTGDVSGTLGGKLYSLQINGNNLELAISTPANIPLLAGVTSATADGAYTTSSTIDITVSFTIPVVVSTTGGTPTLQLATGTTLENAVYIGGSGTTNLTFRYSVQAGDNSSGHLDYTGTTALSLNGGTIKDANTGSQSANLMLSTPGTVGSLGNSKALVIDTTAPTVANVTSPTANGWYTTGTVIDVTTTFSEPVTVDTTDGTPTLQLATGTTLENAVYLSGSGSSVLTFAYTIQAGDNTSGNLDYTDTVALALNGATIKDPAGNTATITMPAPGSAGSLGANKALVIDTIAPTVTSIVDNTSAETAGVGDLITYTLTFDEAMKAATLVAGDFDNSGTASISVGTISQTSSSVYTVQVTPTSPGSLTLRIKGSAAITDLAGNILTAPVTASATVTVHSVTVTWDANGTGTGQTDGSGAWLNASQWWNGSANASWATGLDAAFGNGGTGGTVTLASPTTVNSLTFNSFSGTYTLGTTGQTMTIDGGLTMNSGSGAVAIVSPVTLGATQTWLNNSPNMLSINVTSPGSLNLNGNLLTVDGTGITSLTNGGQNAGIISGSGGLTKNGSGRFIMGANPAPTHTYSGTTTIKGGSILFGGNLPATSGLTLNGGVYEEYWSTDFTRTLGAGAGQVQITGGASGFSENGDIGMNVILNNNASYEVVWGSTYFNPATLVLQLSSAQGGSSLTFQNKIDLNGATRTVQTAKTTGTATGSATLSGVIRNSTGTAGITKTGSGILILSGANTYNGPTTVNAGTLRAGNSAAFGNNSAVTLASATGVVLDLANNSAQVGSLTGGGATGGKVTLGSGTLTVGGDGTSPAAYAGIISGTGGLTKTGIGRLTLTGANAYTGTTTVNAGTLALSANSVLHNTSPVSIGNGTLDAETFTNSAGTLAVTGAATINLGSGAALAFADSHAVAWTGTLNITGTVVHGALRFGTTSSALTAAQLALITVSGGGTATLDADGFLVGGSPYSSWASGAVFSDDANGDGVANGLAWILGAANPSANGQAVLPTTGTESGYLTLHFLRVHDLGSAKLYLQYSNDLNNTDPWHEVDLVAGPLGDIVVVDVPGSLNDDVTVKIPSSHASTSGALFARLQATDN